MKIFTFRKRDIVYVFNVIVMVFSIITLCAGITYKAVIAEKGETPILRVETTQPQVSVTMNLDAYINIPKLLQVLGNNKITFFVSDYYVNEYPDDLQTLINRGNLVQVLEQDMKNRNISTLKEKLSKSTQTLSAITKKNAEIIRFDDNLYDFASISCVRKAEMLPVQWSSDVYSEEYTSGDIILAENIQELKEIFQKLDRQNLTNIMLDELLYKENYIIDANGTQTKTIADLPVSDGLLSISYFNCKPYKSG